VTRTFRQIVRPWVPNIEIGIRHIERDKRLKVRCRQHLGLIVRGARSYEPRYVSALKAAINEGDTVFDVGANIGFYSVLFSTWVGARGKVIAFEPDPANIKLLRRNLQLNDCDNVVLRPVALTNTCGEQTFSLDRVTRMTGHLGNGATYGATVFDDNRRELISVTTSTLDAEVERFGPPDVIKMDIEGGEHLALQGATELLQTKRPIIVSEMNSWAEERAGAARDPQAARYLLAHHYALWDPDSECEVRPESIPWTVVATPSELNYIRGLSAKSVNPSGD
jgi:FkbM family methyltransferase